MISIDQNCHSLWDVLPKLHALSRGAEHVTHFIEDIDVAFTAIGSQSPDVPLRLAPERYYRGGGADWGAALFYCEFLSRLPVDIRRWEPYLGMRLAAAARGLGRSVDELYDEFSPSGNWQLIGPSYVSDKRHHRVIGHLSVAEVAPFVREILERARADCFDSFPSLVSRENLGEWFDHERQMVERLLDRCRDASLTKLYRLWLGEHLGNSVALDVSSNLFAPGCDAARDSLVEIFLRDYEAAAAMYNEALAETQSELRPLNVADGELPCFATCEHEGHLVRSAVVLDGRELRIADRTFRLDADKKLPVEAMRSAGIRTLAGKAILLVIQVRYGPAGRALAVPYNGSLYMPAAHALTRKLTDAGYLPGRLKCLYRVRFGLLDRMRTLDTPIRLPRHLRRYFGKDVIPARELAERWRQLSAEAAERLESFKDDDRRTSWQRRNLPESFEQIAKLNARRRELAKIDAKSPEIRELSHRSRALQRDILAATIQQVADDWQTARIDYWDSRGAILPWCIGLGGREFYRHVIEHVEIYPEGP